MQNRDNLGKLIQKVQISSRSRVLGLALRHVHEKICIGVPGLAPCHFEKPESKLQVRLHPHAVWSSWPGQTVMGSWPPTEVFRLFRRYTHTQSHTHTHPPTQARTRARTHARTHTHTHPAGAGSTSKGKRNRKGGHKRRAEGQNSAGGKGTNGPPEPTYTAKRTSPAQNTHTHLNPTTHYRGARGRN